MYEWQVNFPYFQSFNLDNILLKKNNSPLRAHLPAKQDGGQARQFVRRGDQSISIPVKIRKGFCLFKVFVFSKA
jgi:hypothetical protein